ncbi:hypothetical protein [Thalassovita sp.]|uniref:hypothetical protein n=1 Tax=Thalassovita sp. TaxID=1979401 RepID=UPI002B268933|nr:hypothetical protein [Thalassovita sp.]
MTKPKQPSELLSAATKLGEHYARQHFANHLSAAAGSLLDEIAKAEKEFEGFSLSSAEMEKARAHLKATFRNEWERLYDHAVSGIDP